MADIITPVYGFTAPDVGGSDNTWGTKLNANITAMEALFTGAFTAGTPSNLGKLKTANANMATQAQAEAGTNSTTFLSPLLGKQQGDFNYLKLSGGTVTGVIKGVTPVAGVDLTTKAYVDAGDAANLNQGQADLRYLQLAGGTLIGQANGITPVAAANLTRKDYVDAGDVITNAKLPVMPTRTVKGNALTTTAVPTDVLLDLTWLPLSGFKDAVYCMSTVPVDIALGGLITVDGIVTTEGLRVLLAGQTDVNTNGIYLASAGAWTRAPDNSTANTMQGAIVVVRRGTVNGGTQWATNYRQPLNFGANPINWYQIRLSGNAIRASDLSISPFYNIYPDYNMIDDAFYASSTGAAYSFTATSTVNLGQRFITIPVNAAVMRVESDWFTVENSSEYLITAAAWVQNGAGSGTSTVYIETASDDGTGVATSLGQTLVKTTTDAAFNAPASFGSINFTTPGTARLMRFVGERAAGGSGTGKFGCFKAEKKTRAATITSDLDLTLMPTTGFKHQVLVVCDAPIVLASAGLPIIDNYQTLEGDRVLLVGQAAPAENGIYMATALAGWSRTADADNANKLKGAVVTTFRGSKYGATTWQTTFQGNQVFGTAAIPWFQMLRADGGPITGNLFTKSATPATKSAAATLTAAEIATTMVTYTGAAAANLTLPAGNTIETTFITMAVDTAVNLYIINTGAGIATMLGNTGVTIVGNAAVAIGGSAHFRLRKTALATFVAYRVN